MKLTNGMFDRAYPVLKKRWPDMSEDVAADVLREVLAACVVCQVCDGKDGQVEDLSCRDCDSALHYYE